MIKNKNDLETVEINRETEHKLEPIIIRKAELASYIDEKGLLKFASPDLPRIDHDPNPESLNSEGKHKCLGLLLEPSSTNRLFFSTNLTHPFWRNAHLITKEVENDVLSPEGTSGDGKVISLIDLPGKDFHLIKQNISNPTLEDRTVSIFVKRVENAGSKDFAIWGFGGLQIAVFSRKDWSFISGVALHTEVEFYRNGWVRLSATYRATNKDIYFGSSKGNLSQYEGENKKQFYIYGPQLENLSFSTSYIPSENGPQKRHGDLVYLDDFQYNGESYELKVKYLESIRNQDIFMSFQSKAIDYYNISLFFEKQKSRNRKHNSINKTEKQLHNVIEANAQQVLSEETENSYDEIWRQLNQLSDLSNFDCNNYVNLSKEKVFNYFRRSSKYKIIDLDDLNREEKEILDKLGISLIILDLIRYDDPKLENLLISEFNSSKFELANKVKRKTDFKWNSINKTLDYQQSIIETGYIYSICPISHRIVRSNQSFFQHQSLYTKSGNLPFCTYRFIGDEIFYLVVGAWDGGKLCIYFPRLELIIKFPDRLWSVRFTAQLCADLLNYLKASFVSSWQSVKIYIDDDRPKQQVVILGVYKNLGHYFWNELSGIQRLYDQGILEKVNKFLIGSNAHLDMGNLFPEISDNKVIYIDNLNDYFSMIVDNNYCAVRVTDFYIRKRLAERLKSAALIACNLSFLKEFEKLQKYFPLLWVNLRGHNKVWKNQVEGFAKIIMSLSQDYPNLAIVFDGTPDTELIASQIISLIPSSIKTYNALHCKIWESIVLAHTIDVYIATVGSGLTFLTWLANKPGVAHGDHAHLSQKKFWSDVRENSVPPVFLSEEQIIQDQARMYANYDCDWKVLYDETLKILKNTRSKTSSSNNLVVEKYMNSLKKWELRLNKIRQTLKEDYS